MKLRSHLLSALLLCACSGSSNSDGDTLPAPEVHESPAPACHDVVNVADFAPLEAKPGDVATAPAARGGTIPDGVYVFNGGLFSVRGTASSSKSEKVTAVIRDGKWFSVAEDASVPGMVERTSHSLTIDGSRLMRTRTCSSAGTPPGGKSNYDFTATAAGFTLYDTETDNAGNVTARGVLEYKRK